MKTTIDDLLAASSDFSLCDEVFLRLDAAVEALGVEPTGAVERTILLTWHASGVVGNGGFEYLFEGGFYENDPGCAAATTTTTSGEARASTVTGPRRATPCRATAGTAPAP